MSERTTFELDGVSFDDLGPRRILHVHDPDAGLHAVVVVDTLLGGPSGGGVRMAPDLTLSEIARLARAMTYKYALLGLPIGGAKAGIWLDPADPRRDDVIAAFRAAIAPLRDAGTFMPGPDMGTFAADFASPVHGEVAVDEQLTGYGTVMAANAAATMDGGTLDGRRVAIEGFGKVGAAAARFFVQQGARVVAVSTMRTAIHRPGGLDVDEMLALRSELGDAGVESMRGAQHLPREALLTIDCDVLVPGARPDAIHRGNVEKIGARLIVPGSNAPYAQGTLETLWRRGIVAVPDFVSNAGGVLAMLAALQGLHGESALGMVRAAIERNVLRIGARARETGMHLHDAAVAIAREHLASNAPSSAASTSRSRSAA